MMQFFKIAGFAATLAAAAPSAAHAGVPYGYFGEFEFVTSTNIPGENGPVALCHLTTKYHLGYIGFWRSNGGYALSPTNCEGDSYRALTAEQLMNMQKSGLIDVAVPPEPRMSVNNLATGFAGTGVIGLLALIRLLSFAKGGRPQRRKKAAPQCAVNALAAMCHVAKADGHVDESEVTAIGLRITELTGRSFGREQIRAMIDAADIHIDYSEYAQFAEGLSANDRQIVLEGALGVAVADGQIQPAEHNFVTNLASALGVQAEEFRMQLQKIAAHMAQNPRPVF